MTRPRPDLWRRVHRGGGPAAPDLLNSWLASENCSEVCYLGMRFGGLDSEWWVSPNTVGAGDPHYLKCLCGTSATPPNGVRLQTPSQLGTADLDPLLPQMNITDWRACLGICFDFLYCSFQFAVTREVSTLAKFL